MLNHGDDEEIMKILKDVYKREQASPSFKAKLRNRLTVEAGALPSPLWRWPPLWIAAVAGAAVALVLVITFVIVPAVTRNKVVIPPGTVGTLEVRVTDAKHEPAVTAINVTFDNMSVHMVGGEGDAEGEWIVVAEKLGKTIDLLQLSGTGDPLGQDEIQAGRYIQVRIGVVRVEVIVDGTAEGVALEPTGDVVLPSGELKFVRPFEVKTGETTIITINFDVSADKSVVFAGGKWLFRPTIKLDVTSPGE